MIRIYRDSFKYFLASLPVLLGFAAVIEVLLRVLQPISEIGASFALIVAAYMFHRHFLFGEALSSLKRNADAPPFKIGWFILASMTIILVPVALALVAVLVLGSTDPDSITTLVVIVIFPVYLVALSMFGTALPAVVARDTSYRIRHGLRATFATMWRLVQGPGIVGVAGLLGMILIENSLGRFAEPEGSGVVMAGDILARTFGFLPTILTVAVLCEMYRMTRPEPGLPQGPGAMDQKPA
jgi:hypothetical protein